MIWKLWDHSRWGDSFRFEDFERRRLVGWLTPKPKVGDEVQSKMRSGRIGRFKITKIDECGDPKDMFFADCEDVGYIGDVTRVTMVKEEKK